MAVCMVVLYHHVLGAATALLGGDATRLSLPVAQDARHVGLDGRKDGWMNGWIQSSEKVSGCVFSFSLIRSLFDFVCALVPTMLVPLTLEVLVALVFAVMVVLFGWWSPLVLKVPEEVRVSFFPVGGARLVRRARDMHTAPSALVSTAVVVWKSTAEPLSTREAEILKETGSSMVKLASVVWLLVIANKPFRRVWPLQGSEPDVSLERSWLATRDVT